MGIFEIEKALFKKVEDSQLGIPRNYPNYPGESEAPYANISVTHSDPVPVTLGKTGEDNHTGFLQIMLKYPLNEGNSDAMTLSQSLCTIFQAGVKCIYQGQVVNVTRAGIGAAMEIDDLYCIPVTVYWYARVRRSLD